MAHARSVTVLAFRNSAERSEIRSRAGNIPGAGVLGGRETVVVSCSVPCLSSKLLKTVGNVLTSTLCAVFHLKLVFFSTFRSYHVIVQTKKILRKEKAKRERVCVCVCVEEGK